MPLAKCNLQHSDIVFYIDFKESGIEPDSGLGINTQLSAEIQNTLSSIASTGRRVKIDEIWNKVTPTLTV